MPSTYKTTFASLENHEERCVQLIADDVRHCAFSNCFEIASNSKPYEKIVFGQNQIHVLETLRTVSTSSLYSCAHDEFALVMDGDVEVHLMKLEDAQTVSDAEHNGAVLVQGEPRGRDDGDLLERPVSNQVFRQRSIRQERMNASTVSE